MRPARLLALEVVHAGRVAGVEPVEEIGIAGRRDGRRDADLVEAQPSASALRRSVSSWTVVHRRRSTARSLSGRFSQACGVLDAEVLVDLPRRVRAVQRVEVDAADLVVEQVAALLGRPVDADLGDGLGIVGATADGPEQPGREPRPEGQLGHP